MIPFIDLQAQRRRLGQPLEDAILKVVRSGAYVMGPEIAELELALRRFGQAPFALTCGSGKNVEAGRGPLGQWSVCDCAQMRIGITTYLKPACSGTVINALELVSCSSSFTISTFMFISASIR